MADQYSAKPQFQQHPYDVKITNYTYLLRLSIPNTRRDRCKNLIMLKQRLRNPSPNRLLSKIQVSIDVIAQIDIHINLAAIIQTFDDLEFYRQRCNDLEKHVEMLQNECELALRSQKDQSYNESFVKENSILHHDKEKMSKQLNQKKTEVDIWKQKYENQMQQIIQIKANYEMEIRQLSGELSSIRTIIDQQDYDKQRQILDHKSKIESNVQKNMDDVKRSQLYQNDLCDQQIRKLRESLEDKQGEVDELQAKLLRVQQDDDDEMKRLLKDNEGLRHRLHVIELNKQRELEDLSSNLNVFQLEQLQNLKQSCLTQNNVIEAEVEKFRGLLEIKNAEIQTLIAQNQKLKVTYETEIDELRKEIQMLKTKMLDQERQSRRNLENIQKQLQRQHNEEINSITEHHEKQVFTLEREIDDLKNMCDQRAHELQMSMEEKVQLREHLENQIHHLGRQIEEDRIRTFEMEAEKNREIDELNDAQIRVQGLQQESIDQQRMQIRFLEGELLKQKELLSQKGKDMESIIQQGSLNRVGLEDQNRKLNAEVDRLREELLQIESFKNKEIDEIRMRFSKLETSQREKNKNLEISNEHLSGEIKRLKEQIEIKGKEIDSLLVQKSALEREIRRVRDEVEEFKTKLLQSEREKLQSQEDLKIKLDQSAQYQIGNLKTAFNTQLQVQQDENNTLKKQLEYKSSELNELIERFERIQRSINQSSQMGPETTTNRNTCEAFIRSKSRVGSINTNKYS